MVMVLLPQDQWSLPLPQLLLPQSQPLPQFQLLPQSQLSPMDTPDLLLILSQLVLLVWLLTQTVLSPQLTLHLSWLPVPITWPLKVLLTPLLPQSSLPQPSLPQYQPLPQSQLLPQLPHTLLLLSQLELDPQPVPS